MGINITSQFRECVRKAASRDGSSSKNDILKPVLQQTEFEKAVVDVSHKIQESKRFMAEHRDRYIHPGMISDKEKDEIEMEMAAFVKTCSANVEQLSRKVLALKESGGGSLLSEQAITHRHGMVLISSEQLRELTLMLDAFRTERASRMQSLVARRERQMSKQEAKLRELSTNEDTASSSARNHDSINPESSSEHLMIQEESQALFEELTNLSDRVHDTEKMMQEIASLNQVLSAQVMGQTEQIDKIYSDAVQSSLNMKRGNTHLKKAVELNKSTRKYILFIMIVAALILLFFDRMYS